jgi:hypothetical protein
MPVDRKFEIMWEPRDVPLLPIAAAARGEAALGLARRLLHESDQDLARLEGVAGRHLILVQGDSSLLPWVNGIEYLGTDAGAPAMLLPTNYRPVLPSSLLARAFEIKPEAGGSIALLANPLLLVPLRSARPICRETLASWLGPQ